jgi:parallel beta-helix repeat protein
MVCKVCGQRRKATEDEIYTICRRSFRSYGRTSRAVLRAMKRIADALLLAAMPALAHAACVGVNLPPNATLAQIQAAINANPNGATLCFTTGTSVLSGYIMPKPSQRLICDPRRTCVITGNNTAIGGFRVDASTSGVLIQGFVVKDFTKPTTFPVGCMQVREGGLMQDNEITNCDIGMTIHNGATARGNFLHHNRCQGIGGGVGNDMVLEGNELWLNNTNHNDGGVDCSGSKLVGSTTGATNVTWRNNYVHDNYGQGLWCDGNCKNLLYEGNRIENNSGCGIDHEISWSATIRNNTFLNNGADEAPGQSCFHGGSICVNNSHDLLITGNTVVQNDGRNGICLNASTRTETASWFPHDLANVTVQGNTIKTTGPGLSGLTGNASTNIVFKGNVYYTPTATGMSWQYYKSMTRAQWQAAGQDLDGIFLLWNGNLGQLAAPVRPISQ